MSHVRRGDGTLPQPFWMRGAALAEDRAAARRQWVFGWLSVLFGPACVGIGLITMLVSPLSGLVWLCIGLVCLIGVPLCRRGRAGVVSVLIYGAILLGSLSALIIQPTNPAAPAGLVCLLVLVATSESTRATLFMVGLCAGATVLPLAGRSPDLPDLPVGANLASRVAYVVIVGAIVVVASRSSQRILDEARARGRTNAELTDRLGLNLRTLEAQVAERTQSLAERTAELERVTAELDDSIRREVVLAARMQRLAETDDLTGLANRRGFLALLGDTLRAGGWLALADLDHFKRINDTFGHPTGDQVLHRAAQLMAAALPEGCAVARIGGEEFGLIVGDTPEGARSPEDVEAVLSAVVTTLSTAEWSSLSTPQGDRLRVSVSIGAARFDARSDRPGASAPATAPAESTALSEALRRADAALYAAKASGRGRCWISRETVDC